MPQLSYSLDPSSTGYAGDHSDDGATNDVLSAAAAEEIPFGRLLELQVDGTVRLYRGTGKVFGVSMRRDTRETGSYAIGGSATYKQYDPVPVMRRGRMWVQFESNAASVRLAAPNVWTPSDNSLTNLAKLGTFTSRATAGTTGAEIVAAPSALFFKAMASTDVVALVEFSFS